MNLNLENMSYQEFKEWCEDRACDGRWSMLEAIACLDIIKEIDNIKAKGLFKKKATLKAREEAWKKKGFTSLR